MNKKIILITGWIWYIWSHWVIAFEKAWYKTVIIDNLSNSNLKTLDWIGKNYLIDVSFANLIWNDNLWQRFENFVF